MVERLKIALTGLIFLMGLCQGWAVYAQTDDVLKTEIQLPAQRASIHLLLSQISRQTSYFFIFDSELIDSSKRVRISNTNKPLDAFLASILDLDKLEFRVIENYIVIYQRPKTESAPETIYEAEEEEATEPFRHVFRAQVLDAQSREPLPAASVFIPARGTGISSNRDGYFQLSFSPQEITDSIRVSYIGYRSRYFPAKLKSEMIYEILLERDIISLHEFIFEYKDPVKIVNEALAAKVKNYPSSASRHTSFYREGVLQKEEIINYSEAVFQIVKPPFFSRQTDQVRVLKSRNMNQRNFKDSILLKLQAGVETTLQLDLIKNPPDFLSEERFAYYSFPHARIKRYHNRETYAVSFEPLRPQTDAIFEGTIYIDKETKAIIKIDFQVQEAALAYNQRRYIPKRSPEHHTRMQNVSYSVSYGYFQGAYHLQHVRGDLELRIRRKNRLRSRTYNVFMEKATIQINTEDVSRIRRRDRLRTHAVYAEQDFSYDAAFWKGYNFIEPEKSIREALPLKDLEIESLW